MIEEPSGSSQVVAPSCEMFCYLAKVINPAKKTDFSLRRFRVSTRFRTVQSLRKALYEYFPAYLTGRSDDTQMGYISPGHGVRGRQQWISDDMDIEDMYKEYQGKKEITLWFYANTPSEEQTKKGKKRSHSPGTDESTKRACRTAVHSQKMEEVEEVLDELKKKHAGTYTEEKLRAWAHLIQMNKHKSYSQPPDMPYFKKGNKHTHTEASDSVIPAQTGVSPCKWLTMRTACIEQMDKWHSLLEKGGITQQQYDQLQEKIMSDMLNM